MEKMDFAKITNLFKSLSEVENETASKGKPASFAKNETAFDGEFEAYAVVGDTFKSTVAKKNEAKAKDIKSALQTAAKTAAQEKANEAAQKKAEKLKAQAKKANNGTKVTVNGNKITTVDKNGKKTVQTIDSNGKVSSKTITEGTGANKKSTVINYDKNGKRTDAKITTGEGKNQAVQTIKYKNGVKTSSTTKQGDKTVERKYDKNGHMTKKVETTGTGKKAKKVTSDYKYDKKGNLTSYKKKGKDGTVTEKKYSNYKTDADGNTTRDVKMTVKKPGGKKTSYTEKQTLDKNKKLLDSRRYDSKGKLIREEESEYTKNGQIKYRVITNHQKNNDVRTTYSNYKYSNNSQTMSSATFDVQVVRTPKKGKNSYVREGTGKRGVDGRNDIKLDKKEKKQDAWSGWVDIDTGRADFSIKDNPNDWDDWDDWDDAKLY